MADISDLVGSVRAEKGSETDNKLRAQAEGLPSVHEAQTAAIRKAKRVQLNFPRVPEPVKEIFTTAANANDMKNMEFLLELMRSYGLDVPNYKDLDGRYNR